MRNLTFVSRPVLTTFCLVTECEWWISAKRLSVSNKVAISLFKSFSLLITSDKTLLKAKMPAPIWVCNCSSLWSLLRRLTAALISRFSLGAAAGKRLLGNMYLLIVACYSSSLSPFVRTMPGCFANSLWIGGEKVSSSWDTLIMFLILSEHKLVVDLAMRSTKKKMVYLLGEVMVW